VLYDSRANQAVSTRRNDAGALRNSQPGDVAQWTSHWLYPVPVRLVRNGDSDMDL